VRDVLRGVSVLPLIEVLDARARDDKHIVYPRGVLFCFEWEPGLRCPRMGRFFDLDPTPAIS